MTLELDPVFKALADPTRRLLLDRLRQRGGLTLKQLCEGLNMTRPAVAKHLAVLESGNLVTAIHQGREKLHYLNPVPVQLIHQRWTQRYEARQLAALTALKTKLEKTPLMDTTPDFVYTIYITTTIEQAWRALTDPEFTCQYWGVAIESDWQVGSSVTHRFPDKTEPFFGGTVLESIPPKRLSYSAGFLPTVDDPTPDPRLTTSTFELEQVDSAVRLTVHSVDPREDMRTQVREGWAIVLSALKTLLEAARPVSR